MAVGIPNSGKSTLINALRSVSRSGSGGAARVGRLAGQTRAVGQPIVISRGNPNAVGAHLEWWTEGASSTDFRIMILDTPGILEPQLLVDYLLFWWNHRGRSEYVSVLGLPHPTDNVIELLARVCAQNAFFLDTHSKHAVSRGPSWQANEIESLTSDHAQVSAPRPDLRRAAAHILRLFDRGAFGRTTFLPSDEEAASNYFVLATRARCSSLLFCLQMDSAPMDSMDVNPPVEEALDLGDPPRDWSGWFAYMGLKIFTNDNLDTLEYEDGDTSLIASSNNVMVEVSQK
ncbi:hypothetical protein AHF37_10561 [Paragonimus kellicotti]|nr:hypothetical protein AHF37_10561 [Paragonimus kellicotti]